MEKLNPKARLLVDIMEFDGKEWQVRIHLYDNTTHIIKMPRWSVEAIEGDPSKRGWMLVEHLGQIGDKVAIVLPVPIHEMGTNISVHSNWVDQIRRPIEQILYETLKEKENNKSI
jgi:hypothetical protein